MALTSEQWDGIKADMDEKIQMLTDDEVELVASWLNERVNIPIAKEGWEHVLFAKIVRKVDRFLYSVLPNEIYELIRFLEDGVDDAEAAVMKERLGTLVNGAINLPFIPESLEQEIFEFLLGLIIDAMRGGRDLSEAMAT